MTSGILPGFRRRHGAAARGTREMLRPAEKARSPRPRRSTIVFTDLWRHRPGRAIVGNEPARRTWCNVLIGAALLGAFVTAALAARSRTGVVADDVRQRLAATEWLRVMVLLDPGIEPGRLATAPIAELQERAAKVQDRVLAA